jgi:hypothetical protein
VPDRSEHLHTNGASAPCLFLSHSGADSDAARKLRRGFCKARRRAAGLSVWFDKDDPTATMAALPPFAQQYQGVPIRWGAPTNLPSRRRDLFQIEHFCRFSKHTGR